MGGETQGSGAEAEVVELLPRAAFRLALKDGRSVIAHTSGAGEKNFVRIRRGDRVLVQLSPNDPARGRITRRLEQ